MELRNSILNEEDIDGDLLGRKVKTPMCVRCVYNENGFCKAFGNKIIDLEELGVNIFNCPKFRERNHKVIESLKEFGFGD